MEDIVDLIATDSSASDVSDKLKEILYAKAAERIDIARPYVANAMFGQEFERIAPAKFIRERTACTVNRQETDHHQ